MTLLFWSAKTTLPWASNTADSGEPRAAATLTTPLVGAFVPPPATVVMTLVTVAVAAPAALDETAPTKVDPATTAHTMETTAPTFTRPRSVGVRRLTGNFTLRT